MPSERNIDGRRVVITGASSGVGRALAHELAAFQTHLLLVARREQPLAELSAELLELGAKSVSKVVGDITHSEVRTEVAERVAAEWQTLDILVNNAGTSSHGRFTSSDEATLRGVMEINFFAATELTRLLLPMLHSSSDSVLVNVGSILGHRGVPYNSEYSASKFALRGWSEALRAEASRDGVDVLLVSPGTIDTEFFDHLLAQHEPTPWPPQKGISPQKTAEQIVRAIKKHRREIYPNWRGWLLVKLNRWFPGLIDRVMKRYG